MISSSFGKRLAATFIAFLFITQSVSSHNWKAIFGKSPAPLKIDVDPDFIAETVLKASLTRYTVDLDQPDWVDGPPSYTVSNVRDYWVNQYDWSKVQNKLNEQYNHFTSSVLTGPDSNFTEPVPLHFVHHRSNRIDAILLMFIHGWPGSFMEVGNILQGLLNPPDTSLPAFHVIAPSIPGFAFSPALPKVGWGARESGNAFNSLMQQLGYSKYVIQGGDFGGTILRYMAGDYPSSVVSVLDNMWVIPPHSTDLQRYQEGLRTADENTTIENINRFDTELSGYRLEQETQPLQIAIGTKNSPLGNAMWLYNLMVHAVDTYVFRSRR